MLRRAVAVISGLLCCSVAEAHLSRPDNKEQEPLQYDTEDNVLVYRRDRIAVHYTVRGPNAVDGTDDNSNAVPDRVEALHALYESHLVAFVDTLGLALPPSDEGSMNFGGDERLDVYLLSVAPNPGGYFLETCGPEGCTGFILHPVEEAEDGGFSAFHLFRAIFAGYRAVDAQLEVGASAWAAAYRGHPARLETLEASYRLDRPLFDEQNGQDGGAGILFRFVAETEGAEVVKGIVEGDSRRLLAERFVPFALSRVTWPEPWTGPRAGLQLAPLSALAFRVEEGPVAVGIKPGALDPLTVALVGDREVLGTADRPPVLEAAMPAHLVLIGGPERGSGPFGLCATTPDQLDDCMAQLSDDGRTLAACGCAATRSDALAPWGLLLLVGYSVSRRRRPSQGSRTQSR